MPILDRLLYDSGIDTKGFERGSSDIKRQLRDIGDVATATFQRDIQGRLAKAIDLKNFSADFDKAKRILTNFGITSQDVLKKQLGVQLSQGFISANKEAKGFFSQLVSGSGTLSRFGVTAAGVATGTLAVELVRGFAQASGAAIKFASDFQTSLARVQTIAAEDFNLDFVAEQITNLSTRIPQDVLTLTRGLADIIGAGFDKTAESLQILEVSAKAAVGGFTATGTAASGIVTILNSFGLQAEDAAKVSDILFQTVDEGVISFEDLATQIGDVATPAALANISLEDLGAAIAVSTRAGINAAETMTGLKNAILSIIAPSEGAAKAAKQLGLDFSQAGIEAAGGFNEFVKLIAQATKGDLKTLETLFPEKRALREIAILAGSMGDEFQRLAGVFNDVSVTSGAAGRAFEIVNATAEKQFDLFKNNLNVAVLEFGKSVLDVVAPALKVMNEAFSESTTSVETLLSQLERGGAANAGLTFLKLKEASEAAERQIAKTEEQLRDLAQTAANVESIVVKGSGQSAEARERERDAIIKLAATEEGRAEINRRIAASEARVGEITANLVRLKKEGVELSKNEIAGLNTRLQKEIQLQNTFNDVLDINKNLTTQKKTQTDLDKLAADTLDGKAKKEEEAAEAAKKTADAAGKTTALTEQELRAREKIAALIETEAKQLELLGARTDIERELIAIKQRADANVKAEAATAASIKLTREIERLEIEKVIKKIQDKIALEVKGFKVRGQDVTENFRDEIKAIQSVADRKRRLFADDRRAIEEINRFEREQIDRTVQAFEEKFRTVSRQRIEAAINATLPVNLQVPVSLDVQADISAIQKLSEDVRNALSDIAFPIASFVTDLERLGIATADELVSLASVLDKGLGDVVNQLLNFVAQATSPQGTILGAISAGIGLIRSAGKLISGLFGGGGDDARRAAERTAAFERQRQKAAEDAARAAEKAAEALERLRRAAEEFGAGALSDALNKLNDELAEITNSTHKFTQEQLKSLIAQVERGHALENEIKTLREIIEIIEQMGGDATAERELLRQLLKEQDAVNAALAEFGTNLAEITPLELERLRGILQEKGVLEDVVARFSAFGEGLRGLIDRLQLGFELLETVDPAEKLAELVKALTETFAFAVPAQFADLNEFILGGFEALKQGGQALIDFLISANLEELTAEEFANLLRLLNEFSSGIGQVVEDTKDALAELLDTLQIQFNILDISDPIEKIRLFQQAVKDTFGATIPQSFQGMKEFIIQGFFALKSDAELLKAFLESIGLEELTAEQFRELLLSLESILDEVTTVEQEIADVFASLINKLNLEFELFNVDDPVEKMKKLLAGFVELFGFFPQGIETVRDFISQGFGALTAGGDILKEFLASIGLEELTPEQFEEFLKLLDQFQDEIENTGGVVEKTTDKFAEFLKGFNFLTDILDIKDPAEKLETFRQAVNNVFGAQIPQTVEEMKRFILDGFIAMQGDAEALKIFLERFGLEELTKEQFEDLLRELEGGLDSITTIIADTFRAVVDRLNLEFNLLDVTDPVTKLARLRQEILKEFGAIIPDTTEAIDQLIREGVAALLAGGDALKAFLASVNLEELTAEQFQDFLEFLKSIADQAKKAAGEPVPGDGTEEAIISVVKQITFQQANVMINELATIREVLTQMLELMRLQIPGVVNQPVFADRRIIEGLGEIVERQSTTNDLITQSNVELLIIRETLAQILTITETEATIAFSTTSPERIMIGLLNNILFESATTNDLLRENNQTMRDGFASLAGRRFTGVFGGPASDIGLGDAAVSSLNAIEQAHLDATLQTNTLLAEMAMQMTRNVGQQTEMKIFIVKGETVTETSMADLEEMDRRLIEKSVIRSRSRGVI